MAIALNNAKKEEKSDCMLIPYSITLPRYCRTLDKTQKGMYVHYIVECLLSVIPLCDIKQFMLNKGMKSRTYDNYLRKAKDIIASRPVESKEKRIQEHIAIRERMLKTTTDQRVRLEIVKDIARLEALYETNINVKQTTVNETISTDKLLEVVSIQDNND